MKKMIEELAEKMSEETFKATYGENKANVVICLIRNEKTEWYLSKENTILGNCAKCKIEVILSKKYPGLVSKDAIPYCMICAKKMMDEEGQDNIITKIVNGRFN